MADEKKVEMNEKDLENVAGGFTPPVPTFGILTFDQCTPLLTEAGNRAYSCSDYTLGGGRWSNLHSHINAAEKTTDKDYRIQMVAKALEDLEAALGTMKYLTQQDYEYIKTRLDQVYDSLTWKPKMA